LKHNKCSVSNIIEEQILQGPKVILDNESSIIAFTSSSQDRQDSLKKYANAVGAEFIEINDAQEQLFPSFLI